ncbi:hypothetical protein ROZALSC1DRAFT_4758, partial [Rozella allomycis CSF55]
LQDADVKLSRSIVGSLRPLADCMRPFFSYSASLRGRCLRSPASIHLQAARHALRYLKGTQQHGI